MAKPTLEIRFNPPDLLKRMEKYPRKLDKEMGGTMDKALAHVTGSVPSYPPQNPSSKYARTGTLSRTIGLSGPPDIREIKRMGQGKYEGKIGTRLHYAPYVIGEQTQARHVARSANWWTTATILKRALPGIVRLFNGTAERMAKFLDGKG